MEVRSKFIKFLNLRIEIVEEKDIKIQTKEEKFEEEIQKERERTYNLLTTIIAIDETVVGSFNRKRRGFKGINRFNPEKEPNSHILTEQSTSQKIESNPTDNLEEPNKKVIIYTVYLIPHFLCKHIESCNILRNFKEINY